MNLDMQTRQSPNSWVIFPHPKNPQATLRLFCFPYAGGSSSIFRSWSSSLPKTWEVCSVELPGRGLQIGKELFTQLEPLLQAMVQSLLPYLDKPFIFFGHSLGALISFELARLLRCEYGKCPIHFFVSAYSAPQISDSKPPIHALPEPEFKEELLRLNGTPIAVLENAELMELLLPILRADFAISETYVYSEEAPLDCPITVFGGLQDIDVSRKELTAWQEQTNSAFTLRMFPGDHFFIHSSEKLLLETLVKDIYRVNKFV